HMSVLNDTADPRATKVTTWHANFVRGEVPVQAWWLPESVEDDPEIRAAEMTFWMDRDLRLENPVLIEPVSQEVYAVKYDFDKRTCGETWMVPDSEAEGIRNFKPLPVSTDPLIMTDRSVIEVV
ncbi:MAG: hypothetical protein WCP55_22550, partial [Lentisphaerota bacterium]